MCAHRRPFCNRLLKPLLGLRPPQSPMAHCNGRPAARQSPTAAIQRAPSHSSSCSRRAALAIRMPSPATRSTQMPLPAQWRRRDGWRGATASRSLEVGKAALWRGYSGLKPPLRSIQKFLRRDVDGGGGGATRPSAALAPSAPAAHRLLMRCSRAARSQSRASARSQRCFGRSGHWQRGLRPRWRLRRPLALALACGCLEPGSRISRVCSLASPGLGRHVRFTQKLCSPWGRLILRRAQNSN
jgi:hypothetical protein